MKFLLIDDNIDTSKMLTKFLELHGYECISSDDAKKGLALINLNNFDAILLDLAMPEFTGYDVIEQLCQSGKIKENKIIVFTASTITNEEVNRLINSGVHAVFKKPVEIQLLINALKA